MPRIEQGLEMCIIAKIDVLFLDVFALLDANLLIS